MLTLGKDKCVYLFLIQHTDDKTILQKQYQNL